MAEARGEKWRYWSRRGCSWRDLAKIPRATGSPARAHSVTSGPVTRAGSPPHRRAIIDWGCCRAASRPARVTACPLATCSQHPWFPQPQSGPPGSTMMCPISAANPCAPRNRVPSTTRPPPIPVPTPTNSRCERPRPTPRRYSPHAATLLSLSATVGSPTASHMYCTSGTFRQIRFGANVRRPVPASTSPAAPIPMARTSGVSTARAARTVVSSVACMSSAGVGSVSRARTAPVADTRTAAVLVPPTSMPTASRPSVTRCRSSRTICRHPALGRR